MGGRLGSYWWFWLSTGSCWCWCWWCLRMLEFLNWNNFLVPLWVLGTYQDDITCDKHGIPKKMFIFDTFKGGTTRDIHHLIIYPWVIHRLKGESQQGQQFPTGHLIFLEFWPKKSPSFQSWQFFFQVNLEYPDVSYFKQSFRHSSHYQPHFTISTMSSNIAFFFLF